MAVPKAGNPFRKMFAFVGPGYLVAVGYMDPGNWATDIAGGLGLRLHSALGHSSVQSDGYPPAGARREARHRDGARSGAGVPGPLFQARRPGLWIACELAIIACDLAEVIGTAIALQLLFGLPLVWGVCLTALDVLLILMLQNRGFRYLEAFVISLLIIIAGCFVAEIALSQPVLGDLLAGFIPSTEVVTNPAMLYIAIGILGATVMPHNLYLHSAVVQTRSFERTEGGRREAIRYATIDSTVALMLALFINAAILIVAASTFHEAGHFEVAEIQDAYHLLTPLLGASVASTLFAVALLASGQNSTITATLAGQIVMEGFLRFRMPAWMRRLVTRLLAIVPAVTVAVLYGESGTAKLLVLSQVILSLQLPFAVIPLVRFTSDRKKMGPFVSPLWVAVLAWVAAAVIVSLNAKLLFDVVFG